MPGIVGLITKMPAEHARLQLQEMLAVLGHESFYTTGIWVDQTAGVYVGWVAHKGSFSDGMPLHDKGEDTTLIFSGEEFSEPERILRYGKSNSTADSRGPRYLLGLYAKDPDFFANLNGWFQGLVIERNAGKATLFNDRYGMRRLYYHHSKEAMYFSGEAKAILAVRPELRRVDSQGLGEFVACGCVLENRTLFQDIHLLPPGSAWEFHNGEIARKRAYFRPQEWEDQEPLDDGAYYEQIRDTFTRNLHKYFQGPERVGMSLTGGLDSRMVMAWQASSPGALPCYTFGGMFRECQDVSIARRIARICEQPYHIIPVGSEFLARFAHYAERTVYLSDGCVGVNHTPDLYVNERAREFAPVRMTGNYGSEVFRGSRAFKPSDPPGGLFDGEVQSQIACAAQTYAEALQSHPVSFAVFKQAPWHHYGLQTLEQTQLSLRSPFLDNDVVRTVFRAPKSALASKAISVRLIAEGAPSLSRIETDVGPMESKSDGLNAWGLRRLREFQRKAEYAYDYGMPQWLARVDHVLSPLRLERLFIGSQKFSHFRIWYRDSLATYLRDILLDERALSRPYLRRSQVQDMVQGHVSGKRNHTTALHKLLTLELIHRLFIDNGH